MNPADDRNLIWTVRTFVYRYIVEHERPPTPAETAMALGIAVVEAQSAFASLHRRHALFVEEDGQSIRMANPFSGRPTAFRVYAGGHGYWANCAWDCLGIPAALHQDARIVTMCADSGEPVELAVEAGRVRGAGEVIHFPIPFRRWYDDLIHT